MRLGIREIIFLAVLFGLLGSSYFLVFTKTDQKRRALLGEIDVRRKALADVQASTAGIDDLGRKIDELQKAIAFFDSKLPQEKEVDKILAEVTRRAEANSLQIKTVKTLKTERNSAYCEQPIQMTLSGDFNGFYLFLLELEKLPRLTKLNRLAIAKINERDGEMTAEVTLSIFFESSALADAK